MTSAVVQGKGFNGNSINLTVPPVSLRSAWWVGLSLDRALDLAQETTPLELAARPPTSELASSRCCCLDKDCFPVAAIADEVLFLPLSFSFCCVVWVLIMFIGWRDIWAFTFWFSMIWKLFDGGLKESHIF